MEKEDKPMKKSDMQEKFRHLLDQTKEMIRMTRDKGEKQTAMMFYGKVCGIASAMYAIGIIDFDQQSYIRDEAWAICQGKELDDEAC